MSATNTEKIDSNFIEISKDVFKYEKKNIKLIELNETGEF